MIVSAMVMILYTANGIIEYTYHDGISSCLRQKREISRHGWKDTKYTRYSCESRRVELEQNTTEILRLLD